MDAAVGFSTYTERIPVAELARAMQKGGTYNNINISNSQVGVVRALSRERARRRTAGIEAARSGGRRRAFPLLGSFSSEAAERSAGDQVALNVEGVVDCRMSGEEALR